MLRKFLLYPIVVLLMLYSSTVSAQSISGPDRVQPNSDEIYTLVGITLQSYSILNWIADGGDVTPISQYSCRVHWHDNNHQGSIYFYLDPDGIDRILSVNVGNPVLSVDDIAATYGTHPGNISIVNIAGSPAISNIEWEKSFDDVVWSLTGIHDQFYDPGNILHDFYLRAHIFFADNTDVYTNICYVHLPALTAGSISSTGPVSYNSSPQISSVAASGGMCASIQYEWEIAFSSGAWTSIGTGEMFPAGSSVLATDDMIVRRKATCGTQHVYSNTLSLVPVYVSVDFENLNYIKENTVVVPNVLSWYAADQLPIGEKFQSKTYLDGLGRTIQSNSKETALQNGTWIDNVSVHGFDSYGREDKAYLPFVSSNNPGLFKTNAFIEQANYIHAKFSDNGNTFAQTEYENSNLSRVTKTILPGSAWSNIGPSTSYDLNNAVEVIKIWEIGYNETDIPYTSSTANYPINTLYKTTTTDEKGKFVLEYKDLSGNVIFTKVQDKEPGAGLVTDSYDGWVCTYYVYDDFNRLRYTITPKAVTYLAAHAWNLTNDIAAELCFYNFYDDQGRMIIKHSPGANQQEMVYDNRARLVFNRDAMDKRNKRWLITLTDGYNRQQSTGFIHHATNSTFDYTRSQLQASANDVQIAPVSITSTTAGNTGPLASLHADTRETWINQYVATQEVVFQPGFESETNGAFVAEINNILPVQQTQQIVTSGDFKPATAAMVTLSVNYYDNYSYTGAKAFSSNFSFPATTAPNILPAAIATRTFGFVTGQKVRVIDDNNFTNDNFLLSTTYYDEYGHPLQQISENYLQATNQTSGQIKNDVLTNQYDYAGTLLTSCVKETIPGTVIRDFAVITKYEHDRLGRVISLYKSYGSQPNKKLVIYEYDELGQVARKILSPDYDNGMGLETLIYDYNIQGWLTGINKDYVSNGQWGKYFGMELGYENGNNHFTSNQHNGSITGAIWKSQGDNKPRRYDYNYTNTGYLKNALFLQAEQPSVTPVWNANKYDFSVPQLLYDDNGNLKNMQQKGLLPGQATSALIDDLNYEYDKTDELSNRLIRVTDNISNGGFLGDFKNGTNVPAQHYAYNEAGSLTKDYNKNIHDANSRDGVEYNILNKPMYVTVQGKYVMRYIYDASGSKVARQVTNTSVFPNTSKWQYYINDMVLEDYDVQFFINETGRLRVSKEVSFAFMPAPALNITGSNGMVINGKPASFDFYITDHLENTRMILTEEIHTEFHLATMETGDARQKVYEEGMFGSVDANGVPIAANELIATRKPINVPGWVNHYGNPANEQATKLNSLNRVGPNAFFKVMAGDELVMSTDYYFAGSPANNNGNNLTDVVNTLLNALTGSAASAGIKGAGAQIQSQLTTSGSFSSFIQNPTNVNINTPNAHLNYLFFDENFDPIPYDAVTAIGSFAKPVVTAGGDEKISPFTVKVPVNGYAFVYLSNNSDIDVWFDNFVVSHQRGRILQENHYYPYGLQIAAISSKSAGKMDNLYRYQGAYSEFEEETGWNDFALRTYDAQIGRWTGVDPYDQFVSPYIGMGNDPVNFTDPTGGSVDEWVSYLGKNGNTAIAWVDNVIDQATAEQFVKNIGGTAAHWLGKSAMWTSNINGIQRWLLKDGGDFTDVTSIMSWTPPSIATNHTLSSFKAENTFGQNMHTLAMATQAANQPGGMMAYGILNDGYIGLKQLFGPKHGYLYDLNGEAVGAKERLSAGLAMVSIPLTAGLPLGEVFMGGKVAIQATKSRFIITEGGTAIIENASVLRSSLESVGLSTFNTEAVGIGYRLPNGVHARIMQPSGSNPLRVSFGNGATRVTAEGIVPQKPFGMSKEMWKVRLNELTHVNLK